MQIPYTEHFLLLEDHSQTVDMAKVTEIIEYFDRFTSYGLDLTLLYDILNKSYSSAEKNLVLERLELIYQLEDPDAKIYPKYPTDAILCCKKLAKLLDLNTPILTLEFLNDEEMFNSLFLPKDIFLGFDMKHQASAFISFDKEKLQTILSTLKQDPELKYYAVIIRYQEQNQLAKIMLQPK